MIKNHLYKNFKENKNKDNMAQTRRKITAVLYVILIVEIIYFNSRPVNASTQEPINIFLDFIHNQIKKSNPFATVDSDASERDGAIINANSAPEAAINKQEKNKIEDNITEHPERNPEREFRKSRQRRRVSYKSILMKIEDFYLNFEDVTEKELRGYFYKLVNVARTDRINSYQTVINPDCIDKLIQNFVINNGTTRKKEIKTFADLRNMIFTNYKIINVSTLSADAQKYFPIVKEDFKNMIETHYKLRNPDKQKDLFEEYAISDEQLAKMFLEVNKSPDVYKKYRLGDIMLYEPPSTMVDKTVDYYTIETIKKTLGDLNGRICDAQVKITEFIGMMLLEIEHFGVNLPKFSVTKKRVVAHFISKSISIDLSDSSESTSKLTIIQLKTIWKFTNKCFIHQIPSVFKFIEDMSNIETPYRLENLKQYVYEYRDEYITENNEYFSKIYSMIESLQTEINNVNTSNTSVSRINKMVDEILYLVYNAVVLLTLTIENFTNKLDDVQGYKALVNRTGPSHPLLQNRDEFFAAMGDIKSYVKYIQKIAKYAFKHIGYVDRKNGLNMETDNIDDLEKVQRTWSSYNNKVAEPTIFSIFLNMLFPGSVYLTRNSLYN
ncbi:hypothetical protein NEPAR05_2206 [Nematocida parisii]|nr:hypothetical protein NEPAR05_2206 [Nematocida parisii]